MLVGSLRHHRAQGGFSLIELLVVIVILGIVGSIIAGGLIRGMRADAQAQARVEAFEDMRIAVERISRDVRAASTPLRAIEDEDDDWGVGEGVELQRLRDGEGDCVRLTYWVDDGDSTLNVREERSTDGCEEPFDPETVTERILVPRLAVPAADDDPVFYFWTFDDDGDRQIFNETTDDISAIRGVTITLTRTLTHQPDVTIETDIGLRNAR